MNTRLIFGKKRKGEWECCQEHCYFCSLDGAQ